MKIHLTKPAANDLREIEHYICEDNAAAAKQTVLHVISAIEYLAISPKMGRVGRVLETRELVVSATPFIVIYQIRGRLIMVLRILHSSRKWPS